MVSIPRRPIGIHYWAGHPKASLTFSAGSTGVQAVLNALADKSLLKVISSPSLMVLDNHTASINVGNQEPVSTTTVSFVDNANASTSSVQYKDTGVNLVVTPSVNAGNIVNMQVDQTVTDLGAVRSNANNQPAFCNARSAARWRCGRGRPSCLEV